MSVLSDLTPRAPAMLCFGGLVPDVGNVFYYESTDAEYMGGAITVFAPGQPRVYTTEVPSTHGDCTER